MRLRIALLLIGLSTLFRADAAERNGRSVWEDSVVTLEVTSKDYDYFLPWNKPTRAVRKHGVVLDGRQLLTTAQNLSDRTLIRAQKNGRGRWYNADVKWVDYPANLALVTIAEDTFWQGLRPVELADSVPRRDQYEIVRWRDGNLETRRAEFSKFSVAEGALSFAPRVQLELNTEITGLGWAEPVIAGEKVIGLTTAKGGNTCNVMPAPLIASVLAAQRRDHFPGLGYFDFVWQQGENPATLDYLHLDGEPRGAVVVDVPKTAAPGYAIKERDIILEVEGFPIDIQGDYEDPAYGHLMLENLATRDRFAGDPVRMKVWRDGKAVEVEYRLPKADYSVDLVPMNVFDREPQYLIAGGLVFQPLHDPFLRSWGDEWRRRAPFRLLYYHNQPPTPERPALVILSQVLPDPFNVGYQEVRTLVVDKVNGHSISRLSDLKAALQEPKDGVHLIELMRGDSLQRIVLDAATLETATRRVLERYGIPAADSLAAL